MDGIRTTTPRGAWNKGKLVGQKAPFEHQEIWAIRIRLQMQGRLRDLALFDLGIDSKLRACDLVKLRVRDVCPGERLAARNGASAIDPAAGPVRDHAADPRGAGSVDQVGRAEVGRLPVPQSGAHLTRLGTRQYARIVHDWVEETGLDPTAYGTHSMRRTKPTLIYRRTKNLRAVQLLLGHTKLVSTVRYPGIDVDDALEIAEQTEVQLPYRTAAGRRQVQKVADRPVPGGRSSARTAI